MVWHCGSSFSRWVVINLMASLGMSVKNKSGLLQCLYDFIGFERWKLGQI